MRGGVGAEFNSPPAHFNYTIYFLCELLTNPRVSKAGFAESETLVPGEQLCGDKQTEWKLIAYIV